MGPHTNVQNILQSLVTSCRTTKSLQKASVKINDDDDDSKEKFNNFGEGTTLFCVPWRDDIQSKNEFRCFIKDNSLKAVSQYIWYRDYGWIDRKDVLVGMCSEIQKWANIITQHIGYDHYVLDVHVLFDENDDRKYEVELIECNSFGAQMASASACFHWIRDYNQLHGIEDGKDQIEVRVVVKDELVPKPKTQSRTLDAVQELLAIFEIEK